MQFWSPQLAKNIAKLAAVHRRATKMSLSLRHKSYEERLARLNLFSLEERRLRGKLIVCFKILKGFTNVDANRLFITDDSSRTRSNGVKLRCRQLQLDYTKIFLTSDVVSFHLPCCSVTQKILLKTKLTTISSNKVSDKDYMTRRTVSYLTCLLLTTFVFDYVCPDKVYFMLRTVHLSLDPVVCVV